MDGYKFENGTCEDINECEGEDLFDCPEENRGVCHNIDGGYECKCNSGSELYDGKCRSGVGKTLPIPTPRLKNETQSKYRF